MTSPVLFSTGAAPSASMSRNLVEFKAGKMEMRDKMVHPIKRQGLVYLRQSPDDSLMHFCWKDRQNGVIEDDLILFPDDCEFKRVKECTTGRVYVLKMKSSNRKMFFWMQEAKADRDDEYCKKINELLNNPPRAGAGNDMGGPGAGSDAAELQSILGNITQEQIARLMNSNGANLASLFRSVAENRSPSSNSGASASSTASTTNSAPTSATGVSNNNADVPAAVRDSSLSSNDLRTLMLGAMMEGNEEEANALIASMAQAEAAGAAQSRGQSGASGSHSRDANPPLIDLSVAINSDSLAHLLNDDEFLKLVEPHLPQIAPTAADGQQSSLSAEERKKQFSETVRSSQFRSSLSQFCVALQSGQLGPLMSQFGLNQACIDAASLGNLEAFVRALDAQTQSGRGRGSGSGSGGQSGGSSEDSSKDKK